MNDSGDARSGRFSSAAGQGRPVWTQAGSVSNRWWEIQASGHPSQTPAATSGGTAPAMAPSGSIWPAPAARAVSQPLTAPQEPAPLGRLSIPMQPAPSGESSLALAERQQLRRELEAAHAELAAMHEMLEDLPEIFERKFRQRVQTLVDEQERLMHDNQMLRDRLYALTPASATAPPALMEAPSSRRRNLPSVLTSSLRRALHDLCGRPRARKLSALPDGGRTRAA